MKKLFILTFFLLIFISGCSKKEYKIALISDYPPYIYEDGAKYRGMYVDILDEISKIEKFSYRIIKVDKKDIEEKLSKNEIDGVFSNIFKSDNLVNADNISRTMVKIASFTMQNNLEDLKYKKVGILKNSYITNFVYKIRDRYGYAISEFDSIDKLIEAINSNAIDRIMEDSRVVSQLVEKYNIKAGKEIYNIDTVQVLANKRSTDFLKRYNAGLVELINNGKYNEIKNKYDNN